MNGQLYGFIWRMWYACCPFKRLKWQYFSSSFWDVYGFIIYNRLRKRRLSTIKFLYRSNLAIFLMTFFNFKIVHIRIETAKIRQNDKMWLRVGPYVYLHTIEMESVKAIKVSCVAIRSIFEIHYLKGHIVTCVIE